MISVFSPRLDDLASWVRAFGPLDADESHIALTHRGFHDLLSEAWADGITRRLTIGDDGLRFMGVRIDAIDGEHDILNAVRTRGG